jgi:NitT/TauT family transport system permease protein
MHPNPVIDFTIRYTPLFILAVIWEGASRFGLVSPYALPPLSLVLVELVHFLGDPDFYYHAAYSLGRSLTGFAAAVVFGVVLGIAMARSKVVRLTFEPVIKLIYPMPKSALIPLTILWLGIGSASKIFLIFLGCLVPMTISAFNGAKGTEKHLLWSSASLGASRFSQIADVVFYASLPSILAGMRSALALSFVLFVSSELLMANEGLGYLIRMVGDGGQYAAMFAVILFVVAIGFVADRTLLMITERALRWVA